MPGLVECRSNFEYAERPTALYWEEQRLMVDKIILSWRAPDGKYFRVQTADGQVFELFYDDLFNDWHIRSI
ncbi:MAG: hypothetical protein JW908_12615 [Anaerolineales bacterium]|nr:hypothetical protein [Anaerolineales bacterium]